jgi:hypothetical protein
VTASASLQPRTSLSLSRVGACLAALGASLGLVSGVVELALGPHIRSWVGDKQDTTRLGLATIALSAIALAAAVTWLRRRDGSVGTRLLIAVGLLVPGAICFTTVGRAWYLPGGFLVIAAGLASAGFRGEARDVVATISRSWLAVLTVALGAFYIFLGATALGVAGALGIVGGFVILALVATGRGVPLRLRLSLLVVAALPFALLTWWSIVTPLLAILVIAVGTPALRRANRARESAQMP